MSPHPSMSPQPLSMPHSPAAAAVGGGHMGASPFHPGLSPHPHMQSPRGHGQVSRSLFF
jgi:hypothetical protein